MRRVLALSVALVSAKPADTSPGKTLMRDQVAELQDTPCFEVGYVLKFKWLDGNASFAEVVDPMIDTEAPYDARQHPLVYNWYTNGDEHVLLEAYVEAANVYDLYENPEFLSRHDAAALFLGVEGRPAQAKLTYVGLFATSRQFEYPDPNTTAASPSYLVNAFNDIADSNEPCAREIHVGLAAFKEYMDGLNHNETWTQRGIDKRGVVC